MPRMDTLILQLGLALAIGLLVGVERGWRERDAREGGRVAGIRTYGISGLLGGIMAALAQSLGSAWVLIAGLVIFATIFAGYKTWEAVRDETFSVTGVVAGLGVFALGALAVTGAPRAAAAAGVALAAILASRDLLHQLLRSISWVELRSALMLAVMTAIVLPLLPAYAIDPWGGFNPYQIWLFTVLTAAISFSGYVAVRLFGATKGVLISGLAGAIVSSTAVTVALARRAANGADPWPLAGAAALAAGVSVLRVAGIILLVAPAVLGVSGLAILAGVAGFWGCGTIFMMRGKVEGDSAASSRNPFDLAALLLFAVAFAVVSTISAALAAANAGGMVATSAITGIFDVDVAVLSALRLLGQPAPLEAVGHAVLLALSANAFGRLVVAGASGPARFWIPLAVATALAGVLGYAAFITLPHFNWPGSSLVLGS